MKTVRFAQVVAKSGKPETHSLWTSPAKDSAFKAALKSDRIMTVHQPTVGTAADHGSVGYDKSAKGTLLVFPRSLKRFANRRVIGIDYDLLDTPRAAKPEGKTKLKLLPKPKPDLREEPKSKPERKLIPKKSRPQEQKKAAQTSDHKELAELKKALRKAMKDLKQGKAVAAYQVLEKALV